ncbi:hypothetical protein ACVWZX_003566 [Deinococcus sp. UYEF24]
MAHSLTMHAHRTPFGPLPPAAPEVGENLERVAMTRSLMNTLHSHLFPRPAPQLGLLFGQVRSDVLTLAVAMRAVWPTVKPYDLFDVDERLLLGASEALAFLSRGRLQWRGVWYMHADAQLAGLDRDMRLIQRATRRGLCDDRQVMVVAGRQDGRLSLRTLLGGSSSALTELPTILLGT